MGRIAFVFSGQGDQFPGMGKELYEQYPVAKEVFRLCDAIRPETSAQCFGGTDEELKQTKNTQPCLFAMELAAASVLVDHGITPEAVAGFSLGEVVAATFSGLVDQETGFRLVCRRGELMQSAAEVQDTSMAAVVKLDNETVKGLCSKYSAVYPVNFNCPGQVSVAGLTREMADFSADVKAAGGRALPIKVKGGFHSPFMNEASAAFAEELSRVTFNKSRFVLYSNKTAKPYTDDAAKLLSEQICSPVLWESLIRNMIESGIDTFIEVGPGKTLTNMIKKISPEVKAYSVSDLPTVLSEVSAC
ncbi:MAG: ACP S-malonyltransferase [Clostridia bacterium]|nr:ACP S-malonyltransferase [Clostridia bacterium]